ncbi:MAG: hypothetical protein NVSMB68_13530 [Thermoanaerobaculia bacterium]
MKTLATALTLTLLGTSAIAATASQDRAARVLAATPGLLTLGDDDGGRVEIFRHGQTSRTITDHGGAVIRDPRIQIVFLGDWSATAASTRKVELRQRVERISTSDSFQSASAHQVRTTGMLVEARDLEAAGTLNDLRIQSRIEAAMSAGTLPLRNANAVHLIFLAPGLHSTLGNHAAVSDYSAYHSHVQIDEVNVRYVVIPFDEDLDSSSYGKCRGTGVLRQIHHEWKIEQYNLEIPVPNALAKHIVEEIREGGPRN